MFHSGPGRPAIEVDITVRTLQFTWTKIANILEISRSTLYRRLDEEGISHHTTYTSISDAELDQKVIAVKNLHPNDGERVMIGHLAYCGIIIPRSRLCVSIHRVDLVNTAIRRSISAKTSLPCGRSELFMAY